MMNQILTKDQINYIKTQAKDGKSLRQIYTDLSIPKTTAYWWFKKTVGKKIKPVIINFENEQNLGEILGAFCGDGNFFFRKSTYHYRISFAIGEKEKEYALFLAKLLETSFSRKPFIFCHKSSRCFYVVINGKAIYNFIKENVCWKGNKTYTICLKNNIDNYSNTFLKGFIRGLFDTDGYVDSKKSIGIAMTSKKIIKQTSDILSKFQIDHTNFFVKSKPPRKKLYGIRIPKRQSTTFIEIIGFSNPIKLYKLR